MRGRWSPLLKPGYPDLTRDLSRLLRPKSVAVIGGGAWCRSVVEQLQKAGYTGQIWPVHPRATEICGLQAFDGVPSLPDAPDAAFVGINRDATVGAVERLARRGAGGAVCFASGFAEAEDGLSRSEALVAAAGDMPILGPNCYGMINALDGALLWPDQHGTVPVKSGVAILTQSSNIAINLTMQARALPISYMITCGNQAQTSQAAMALALLDDPRVTAIGLHVEGFGDVVEWQALARQAQAKGVPLVALKVGRSAQAQEAAVSHTASLSGQDAAAAATLHRLGIARVHDLSTFVETLKILHHSGPIAHAGIATISCSGGEAGLSADLGTAQDLSFPPLTESQKSALFEALGPKVALANPLDYHTYIWRDVPAMTKAFQAMLDHGLALVALVVDFPRPDRCDPQDWECVIEAAIATAATAPWPVAMIATLPELMPEAVARRLMDAGVIPLAGLNTGLAAICAAVRRPSPDLVLDLHPKTAPSEPILMCEASAKRALSAYGLEIPKGSEAAFGDDLSKAAADLSAPLVLKGLGLAHKSEAGAVHLGLSHDALANIGLEAERLLIEEMVTDGIAELLVGITVDPALGLMLTIGEGGVLTELRADTVHLMIPSSPDAISDALGKLRCAPLLRGYRGKPAVDERALVEAILAIQSFACANADRLTEVEVNPLICTPTRAVAVDALIRIAPDD